MYVSKLSYLAQTCQCLQRQHKYNVYVTITLYYILFFFIRIQTKSFTLGYYITCGYWIQGEDIRKRFKDKNILKYTPTIKHSGEQTKRRTI